MGKAVVVHTALFDEIATDAQLVIADPFAVKLTVPVAPLVTVAVSVTVCPYKDVAVETINETDEVVPCTVLDPFAGSGTTLAVAKGLGRNGVGCELNPEYAKLAEKRIGDVNYPEAKLF